MALKRATSPQCDGVVTLLPSLMKKLEHVETPPWTRFLVGPIDMRLAVIVRDSGTHRHNQVRVAHLRLAIATAVPTHRSKMA